MPTLTQLRAFNAAVEGGSFSAAAREMGFSQPAISDLVRRLEEELQTALFIRGPRRLKLTAAGEEFLPHSLRATAATTAAVESVDALKSLEGGSASFGLLRNSDYYHLANLVHTFHTLHPKVSIKLLGRNSAETVESVVSGELEAGLVVLNGMPKALMAEPIARDEVVHVSLAGSAPGAPLRIEEFLDRPVILYDASHGTTDPTRSQMAARARAVGRELNADIEVERVETALDLAASGYGETFVCRAVARSSQFPDNLVITSYDPPVYDIIALIKRKDHVLSPATRELARLAAQTIRTFVGEAGVDSDTTGTAR